MPAAPINKSMSPLEWAMLVALSVLWGGSFFFNGVAVRELPTLTIVVGRFGIGALILVAVLHLMGQRMPAGRRIWAMFLAMGLLNNVVPGCLIVWGQAHMASGVASILNATTPLFTVIVAHVLTADEKMSAGRLFGVALGFAGVVVMIGGDVLRAADLGGFAPLAILGGAVSYAFAGVFGRRFKAMGVSSMATATGQTIASATVLIPMMLVIDRPWTLAVPSLAALAALVGLALLSTALAYILYFRILATAGATNLLLVTFLIPVSAILLGIGFLDEVLAAKHVAGMALIGAGLAAIDGRVGAIVGLRAAKPSNND